MCEIRRETACVTWLRPAVEVAIIAVWAGVGPIGCHSPKHPAVKAQAEQRWKDVRARIKLQLAEQQYNAGLFEDAAETAAESLELCPTQPEAYVILARSYLELSRLGSAQQVLDAARRSALESPDLIYTQGVILEQQGHIEDALARYSEAQSLDPTSADYLTAAAECMVATGRDVEALELLDEHLHCLDDNGTVAVLAASVAAAMGDVEGAARRLSEAVVPPASRDVVAEELGVILAGLGRCEEAVDLLKPLLSQGGEGQEYAAIPSPIALRALAGCLLTLDNPSGALRVLDDYGRGHPEDALVQLLLAKAALATGDELTALRSVALLERQMSDDPEVKLVRAVLKWRRGELAGAAALLKEILMKDPEDVEAHCLLAEILLAQQRCDIARVHFERALSLDPNCTWAIEGLKPSG